jgi:hypothetical protein
MGMGALGSSRVIAVGRLEPVGRNGLRCFVKEAAVVSGRIVKRMGTRFRVSPVLESAVWEADATAGNGSAAA